MSQASGALILFSPHWEAKPGSVGGADGPASDEAASASAASSTWISSGGSAGVSAVVIVVPFSSPRSSGRRSHVDKVRLRELDEVALVKLVRDRDRVAVVRELEQIRTRLRVVRLLDDADALSAAAFCVPDTSSLNLTTISAMAIRASGPGSVVS